MSYEDKRAQVASLRRAVANALRVQDYPRADRYFNGMIQVATRAIEEAIQEISLSAGLDFKMNGGIEWTEESPDVETPGTHPADDLSDLAEGEGRLRLPPGTMVSVCDGCGRIWIPGQNDLLNSELPRLCTGYLHREVPADQVVTTGNSLLDDPRFRAVRFRYSPTHGWWKTKGLDHG